MVPRKSGIVRTPLGGQSIYPPTLQAQIMRHMLNLAKEMASGDLLESRKKLEEYPLGDGGVARWMTLRTTHGAGTPTSLIVPCDGCETHINGRERIPTT